MRSLRHIVLQVLALHTRRHASSLHPWQDLDGDLDMTPLEVVLVAMEIEGIEDVDIDVTGLDEVKTVGEALAFFEREVPRARQARIVDDVA
jgi:hypothetical protein